MGVAAEESYRKRVMPSAPVPPHETKLNSTTTGTLPAKLNPLLRASPFALMTAVVRRSHPEPAVSIDGAVRTAELVNVHPGAVVPSKDSCSLNCAFAGLAKPASSIQHN